MQGQNCTTETATRARQGEAGAAGYGGGLPGGACARARLAVGCRRRASSRAVLASVMASGAACGLAGGTWGTPAPLGRFARASPPSPQQARPQLPEAITAVARVPVWPPVAATLRPAAPCSAPPNEARRHGPPLPVTPCRALVAVSVVQFCPCMPLLCPFLVIFC